MRNLPIDIAAFMAAVRGVSAIDAVVDFDTGEQKRDRDGVPKWRIELLVREAKATKSEVVVVNFAAVEPPVVDHTAQLVITGLVGRPWENSNDYGHSSGVSLSAESVRFVPASRSVGPNGAKPEPVAA